MKIRVPKHLYRGTFLSAVPLSSHNSKTQRSIVVNNLLTCSNEDTKMITEPSFIHIVNHEQLGG